MRRRVERTIAGWRSRVARYLAGIAGLEVEESADSIVVRGRRLRERWLADPRLRDLASRL